MNRDQASALRDHFEAEEQGPGTTLSTRVISFTSGKGGVGKTNIVSNLGIQLASLGKKVLVIDADLGLANIDIILKLSPKYTIEDVLMGKKDINDVIIEGPGNIHVLPASSGLSEMADMSKEEQMSMLKLFSSIHNQYDYFLIDTGAGISSNVLRFNASADEICIITTSEPTSMTDAYAMMKIIATKYQIRRFNLIVNLVQSLDEAKLIYYRLNEVCNQFLDISLVFIGYVPKDDQFPLAIKKQTPLSLFRPNSPTVKALNMLANNLEKNPGFSPEVMLETKESFWKKLALWKRKH